MVKLGVIGGGFVGNATARVFMEHCEGGAKVYDIDSRKASHSLDEVLACDFVFVCLPTPEGEDGKCNTSIVEEFVASLAGKQHGAIVLRSTLPIGFTLDLSRQSGVPLIHSPEFLTARCAVTDAHTPARMIVGRTDAEIDASKLAELYRQRFPGVPVIECTSTESEAIKLIQNAFFAVKVWFFNEARLTCSGMGANWEAVRQGLLSDGRIAHAHTQVPGPDGRWGFGGACLPKDLANFASLEWARNCASGLVDFAQPLKAIVERNHQLRGEACVAKSA